MKKIIVNKKTRTVIYDTEKKIYKKYIRPKFNERLKNFWIEKKSWKKCCIFIRIFKKKRSKNIRSYFVY